LEPYQPRGKSYQEDKMTFKHSCCAATGQGQKQLSSSSSLPGKKVLLLLLPSSFWFF